MFRLLSRLLVLLGVLAAIFVALVVGVAGYLWYWEVSGTGTLPNGVTYTRYKMETTQPLTVEEARKHWRGFAFPDSAVNVKIAAYHEWQAAIEVVSFEAPVEDCLATARQIVGAYNASKQIGESQSSEISPGLNTYPFSSQLAPLKAPWFTPEAIHVGELFVGTGSDEYKPAVWVDTARGKLYFHRAQ